MDRGIDTRSPLAKKSMQPRMLRMFSVFKLIFYCVFLIALFLVTSHSPLVRITHIEVEGGNIVPNELVQAYVASRIARSDTHLLPQDSVVSIAKKSLEKDLRGQFKMIQNVQVSTQGLHTLRVVFEEYISTYAYCDDRACVSLRNTGEIIAPLQGTHTFIKMRGDNKEFSLRGEKKDTTTPTYGQKILDQESWQHIMQTIQTLQKFDIVVSEVELLPLRFFVVRASAHQDQNLKTEFRMRSDEHFAERLRELELAFENGLRMRATQEHLIYVISYVTEKVIYRFK